MANQKSSTLLDEVKTLLQKDKRFTAEEQLLKNVIVEHALKLDKDLIKLLLSNNQIKEHFFCDIDGTLVFDKDKFISFVDNKQFLPDSYTAFKNKIGLTLDGKDDYLKERKDVVLVWPYKDCVLEGGQTKEDQKRDEIFWNETLAPDEIDRLFEPKVLTNFKRIDKKGEHKVSEIKETDNLIIKGNNLLTLHILKKKFAGEVKLIYIDPPFNRKADTFYNDSFNHSSWLTFMKNRFEVAKNLLTSDGFICVHLDNNEMAYCKVLLDEIFGKDNYRNTITMTTNEPSGFKATGESVFSTANYILVYNKGETKSAIPKLYIETVYDNMYNKVLENRNDPIDRWKWKDIGDVIAIEKGLATKKEAKKKLGDEFETLIADFAVENADRVFRTAAIQGGARKKRIATINKSEKHKDKIFIHPDEDLPDFYILNGEQIVFYDKRIVKIDGIKIAGQLITDVWTDISWTGIANEGGVKLKNGKKPEKLIDRILQMFTHKGDLVLDYNLGSGTTAAVAHKTGRQYIGIEQLDYSENDSVVRLKNVINGDKSGISKSIGWQGGGDFVYCELMQWNEAYVDKIQKAKTKADLAKIWQVIREKAHLSYQVDLKKFDNNVDEFETLSFEDKQKFLLEVLDKNQLYVNYCEIDDADYKVSEEDKKLNKLFYGG